MGFRSSIVLTAFAFALTPQSRAVMQTSGDGAVILRANTRVVEVNVSVKDSKGNPLDDLHEADFTITDNGKPRSFTIFSHGGVGPGAAASPSVARAARTPRPELPPGSFSNIGEPARLPEGHSTVILLDAINGWAENFMWSRKGVLEMLNKAPADEKIALYVITKEDLGTIQDYTTDRARLLDAMKNYIVRGMQPAPPGSEPLGQGMMSGPAIVRVGKLKGQEDGGGDSATKSLGARKADMSIDRSQPAMLLKATESVRLSLKALAEKLTSQPGRKSVFWMTEGFPPSQIWGVGQETWEKTISELNDANVQVNTIDSNGLGGPPRYWGWGGIRSMQQLAEETGGKAYYSRNDLDGALLEGIADSRDTYTLGFYLAEVDGKYHELKVNVDRPGMSLNYRQGYYSLDEPKPDTRNKSDLAAALLNPDDSTAVGIVASFDMKPGTPRGLLNLRLRLDPDTLSLKDTATGRSGKVEELFVEFNEKGREVGRITAASPFVIRPENQTAFQQAGVTMVQSFGVAADAVKLTIIVRDSASGRVGSLTVPLEKTAQPK